MNGEIVGCEGVGAGAAEAEVDGVPSALHHNEDKLVVPGFSLLVVM
jgi:hypothetical protein